MKKSSKKTNDLDSSLKVVKAFNEKISDSIFSDSYTKVIELQRSISDTASTLTDSLALNTAQINEFNDNIVSPLTGTIADVGLSISGTDSLISGIMAHNKSIYEIPNICLGAIEKEQKFILSSLEAVTNTKSFNDYLENQTFSARVIMDGLSDVARALPTYPISAPLPELEILKKENDLPEEELAEHQKQIDSMLQGIDPELIEIRMACWQTFKAKKKDYIGQSCSSMRRLVDKLLRKLAPNKELGKTLKKGEKIKREDRIGYIATGNHKGTKHLARLTKSFLETYDNLPAWDHEPFKNDDFVHGAFIAIEGHILSLLSTRKK